MAYQGTGYEADDAQEAQGWVPNWAHTGLDYLGMIPGYGAAADVLNAGLYLTEGDLVNAGMSGFAAIPGAGDWAGAGKIARNIGTGAAKFLRSGRGAGDFNENLQEFGMHPVLASVISSAGMGGMSALGRQPLSAINFLKNTGKEGWQDFQINTIGSALRQKFPALDAVANSIGFTDPWKYGEPLPESQGMASAYSTPFYQEDFQTTTSPVQRRLEQGGYWSAQT